MPYDFSRMQVERSVYDDQFTDVMLEKHFHVGTTWGTWGGGYPYKEPPQPEQGDVWPPHGDLSFVPTKDRWTAVSLYQESPLERICLASAGVPRPAGLQPRRGPP